MKYNDRQRIQKIYEYATKLLGYIEELPALMKQLDDLI